jgi:uncharacterized protein with HEPN domain
MTEKGRKYLSDILEAINLINQFTQTTENFEDYNSDLKTQSAVERQLGIIGEAVNKFSKNHPEIYLENSKQIVGFRNRIIHAYDSIDNSMIWVIIKRHFRTLKNRSC